MNVQVVIMAGGIGSRLWPVSLPERPKQFMDLLGIGKSMIQLTVERFLPVCDLENFWVVTSERYVDILKEQLPQIPKDHILAEPEPRSTAPCIAYACWKIAALHPDANVVVTPADALVVNVEKFSNIIRTALNFTEKSDSIVTVGIEPTRPDTGYGYICASENKHDEVVKVDSFKEKPDEETAKKYISDGNYCWNAGIFVWNINTIIFELRKHVPAISAIMDKIATSFGTDDEAQMLHYLFPRCEKISIDYAIMEKSKHIYVIAADLLWSDLGSYESVRQNIPLSNEYHCPDGVLKDEKTYNNKVIGHDVRLFDCNGCIVHVEDSKTVIIKGLKDYIVATNNNNVLVCPLKDEQSIKEFSAKKK